MKLPDGTVAVISFTRFHVRTAARAEHQTPGIPNIAVESAFIQTSCAPRAV